MLKFYVSCRPIRYSNELITPRDQFEKGFKGLDIIATNLCMNTTLDGRMLYEVIIGQNSSYSDADCAAYQAIIIEGLAAFSCHLKTVASAQALINKISGVNWTISTDGLSLVPPPKFVRS
jgi:hypothetical protein